MNPEAEPGWLTQQGQEFVKAFRWLLRKGYLVGAAGLGLLLMLRSDWVEENLSFPSQAASEIGAALVAVFFVSFLYERYAKRDEMNRIVQESVRIGIREATTQYQENFKDRLPDRVYVSVPERVYDRRLEADPPASSFAIDHTASLRTSNRYWLKSVTGKWSANNVHTLTSAQPALETGKDIRFILLDPRVKDLFLFRASCERPHGQLEGRATDQILEVFHAVLTLFTHRYQLPSSISFYRERPFYRVELFERELYVTFYERVGKSKTHDTFRFPIDTFAYHPFKEHLQRLSDEPTFHLTSALRLAAFSESILELAIECGVEQQVAAMLHEFTRRGTSDLSSSSGVSLISGAARQE